jgi:tryptophan-rich sensory protein
LSVFPGGENSNSLIAETADFAPPAGRLLPLDAYFISLITTAQKYLIPNVVWSKYSADLHWLMAAVNLGRRL